MSPDSLLQTLAERSGRLSERAGYEAGSRGAASVARREDGFVSDTLAIADGPARGPDEARLGMKSGALLSGKIPAG